MNTPEVVLIIAANALAFWQRHIFLYILVFILDTGMGLATAASATVNTTDWYFGIGLIVLGMFTLGRAAMKSVEESMRRKAQ